MPTVKAMTFTIDSLLPKLDYNVGYDVVVKGASVVVILLRLWDQESGAMNKLKEQNMLS